jgi:hypothetical protein
VTIPTSVSTSGSTSANIAIINFPSNGSFTFRYEVQGVSTSYNGVAFFENTETYVIQSGTIFASGKGTQLVLPSGTGWSVSSNYQVGPLRWVLTVTGSGVYNVNWSGWIRIWQNP